MNKDFGGQQPRMRATVVPTESPKYAAIYSKGEVQPLVFQPGEEGPYYLSEQERRNQEFNQATGRKGKKDLTKKN